ncbi:P-II family nitrogen regulator [Trujillonella humicola]|uniref:P-II family nitrogen regulator n=1 Tax=Trujillonella humicola TaxID=3383699 RepID=UPI003905D1DF
MRTVPVTCVTIVAEAVVEHRLLRDVQAAGARGWTVTTGRGRGTGFVQASEWEGANVRIETLVSSAVADALLEMLARDYFPHYAVIAWTSPVAVVRPDKFL